MSNNIHKFHIKNLVQTKQRAISFVESVESLNYSQSVDEIIDSNILKKEKVSDLLSGRKAEDLIKLFSILKLSKIQNFFSIVENTDKINLLKAISIVNSNAKKEDEIKNMVDRIIVIHKMAIIKKIFSEDRLRGAQDSIKKM